MAAGYAEHSVAPALSSYVACYWTHDLSASACSRKPILPDGCIDLLFESRNEALRVIGTMTQALWTEDCGPNQFIGVRFKAGGAVPFLRDRADLLTDDVAEADGPLGSACSRLREQLAGPEPLAKRVRALETFLMVQLREGIAPVDSRVEWAASKLIDDPTHKIDHLTSELGLSRQYFRRLFLHHTGLSPKVFARVARLGSFVERLRTSRCLVEAALGSGYVDQAHMSHEFKRMVGTTPAVYQGLL